MTPTDQTPIRFTPPIRDEPNKKPPAVKRGGLERAAGRPSRGPQPDQFFDWSTSLFLAIQGIMARSSAPTVSIGWAAFRRRRAVMLG